MEVPGSRPRVMASLLSVVKAEVSTGMV